MNNEYTVTRSQYYLQRIVWGILIIAGIALVVWFLMCPSKKEVYIGSFESKDAALRVAIKKLVGEISSCPHTEKYLIIWRGPEPDENQRVDRRALSYSRGAKWLGYAHDVYSGTSGKAYIVDDAAIRAVAEKGGTLEDFAEYDQSDNKKGAAAH